MLYLVFVAIVDRLVLYYMKESVIEIEVIERNPPPKLTEELDHKDWVSSVNINNH